VRSLVGILFLLGGLVGFLPVVGFWMIPLGLVLIWFDIAALMRGLRRRRGDDR
jgi:fatty acid desaturase